jgi:ADP-ribose pyrophosphatase YjhB (NUDIX family)
MNPRPVAVMLVPVDDGVLLVRRNIEPRRGELALPGGYIDLGETWQEAGAREVAEETTLQLDPATIRDFGALTDAEGGFVLIFGLAAPQTAAALAAFTPNSETQEWTLARGPQELAFPLHTEMLARYFAGRG